MSATCRIGGKLHLLTEKSFRSFLFVFRGFPDPVRVLFNPFVYKRIGYSVVNWKYNINVFYLTGRPKIAFRFVGLMFA